MCEYSTFEAKHTWCLFQHLTLFQLLELLVHLHKAMHSNVLLNNPELKCTQLFQTKLAKSITQQYINPGIDKPTSVEMNSAWVM
jgi:hypothetical protein